MTNTGTGGSVTFSNVNTYTGPTTISNGAGLFLTGSGSIATSSLVTANGAFDISGTTSGTSIQSLAGNGSVVLGGNSLTLTSAAGTFGGVISGTGSLNIAGGVETLGGANTYSGGTTISQAGTVIGNTASLQGNIANFGSLVLNQGSDGQYAGVISGTGTLTKTGSAALLFSGANTYSGITTVLSGTFAVSGSLNSPVIVNTGGWLQGTGIINNTVNLLGSLAPGNSPGTLTVSGTVSMIDGSRMLTEIDGVGIANGAGNYDRLLITGAANQFVVDRNVTLALALRGITGGADNTFVPAFGDTFRIVTAEGGINGRFDVVDQPVSGLPLDSRFYPFYNVFNSNSIDLHLIPLSWQSYFSNNGGNENAHSVGQLLDRLIASDTATTATSRQQELLYSVAGSRAAQLPVLATKLSGEVHAAMAAEIPLASFWLQSTVSDLLGMEPLGGTLKQAGDGFWIVGSRNWEKWYGDAIASSFDADRNQYAFGFDMLAGTNIRLGAGYSYATIDLRASHEERGSVTEQLAFLYGHFKAGKALIECIASCGPTVWESTRPDPLGLTTAKLGTNDTGLSGMGGITVRVPMTRNGLSVQPYASAIVVHQDRSALNEGESSPAALNLPGYTMNGHRLLAGLSIGSEARNPMLELLTFTLTFSGGLDSPELANPHIEAYLADSPFTIVAPSVSRSFFQTKAAATLRLAKDGYGYLNYSGLFRSGTDSQGLELGIKFTL